MPIRHPIQYKLSPQQIDQGSHWIIIRLKNIGRKVLNNLDVNLNSLDSLSITVETNNKSVVELRPDDQEELSFKINAHASKDVYISISGLKEGKLFYWESPHIRISIGSEVAKIKNMFVMSEPYPTMGGKLEIETILKGKRQNQKSLRLEIWAQNPKGKFKELAEIKPKMLSKGEEIAFSTEIIPKVSGEYIIHSYLFQDDKRIGHEIDKIVAVKKE